MTHSTLAPINEQPLSYASIMLAIHEVIILAYPTRTENWLNEFKQSYAGFWRLSFSTIGHNAWDMIHVSIDVKRKLLYCNGNKRPLSDNAYEEFLLLFNLK